MAKLDPSSQLKKEPTEPSSQLKKEPTSTPKKLQPTLANTPEKELENHMGNQHLLQMPGGLGKECFVPDTAIDTLVARGFLVLQSSSSLSRHVVYKWNHYVPVEMQWEHLLDVMPSGPQREAMSRAMGLIEKPHQPAALVNKKEAIDFEAPQKSKGNIKVSKEAQEYVKPTDGELEEKTDRRTQTWPCKPLDPTLWDLEEVNRYIRQTTKNSGTADIEQRGVRYLLEIFDYPMVKQDVVEIVKTLYAEKLIHKAMDMDILHPSVSWTRPIKDGMHKLLDFTALTAEDNGDQEGQRIAQACRVRFHGPLTKKLAVEKEKQRQRRNELDEKRSKNLPKIEMMNSSAEQAMFDATVVHAEYLPIFIKEGEAPPLVRRFMKAAAYGVKAYRTFVGRPGEWGRMLKVIIQACLDDPEAWYIVITGKHKTKKTFPKLGRFMPNDVKYMFKLLIDLADPSSPLLYQPQTASGKVCQLAKLARDFRDMWTPGYEFPEPTLIRKFSESLVEDKDHQEAAERMAAKAPQKAVKKKVGSMMAAASGHSEATKNKYYNLNSCDPEEHSIAARAYIEEFIGPVLVPPTAEQLERNKQRTAQVILEEFKVAVSRTGVYKDDDASDDEEGASESDDEGDQVRPTKSPQETAKSSKANDPSQQDLFGGNGAKQGKQDSDDAEETHAQKVREVRRVKRRLVLSRLAKVRTEESKEKDAGESEVESTTTLYYNGHEYLPTTPDYEDQIGDCENIEAKGAKKHEAAQDAELSLMVAGDQEKEAKNEQKEKKDKQHEKNKENQKNGKSEGVEKTEDKKKVHEKRQKHEEKEKNEGVEQTKDKKNIDEGKKRKRENASEEKAQKQRTKLTVEQKKWIVKRNVKAMHPVKAAAPKSWFAQFLQEGVAEGVFTEFTTTEGLRTFVRTVYQKYTEKAKKAEEKQRKKDEKEKGKQRKKDEEEKKQQDKQL